MLSMVCFLPAVSSASAITYFGQDLGAGESTPLALIPNSLAAQTSFLSGLSDPGVETFEGIAAGSTTPLAISFANGVTATLTGSGAVVSLTDGTTNGAGRYGITGDIDRDERYWDAGGNTNAFTITFSSPISAFGFFGIDIGDFNGQVTLTTAGGLNQVFNIGNSTNIAGGSVLFWGVIDPNNTFTSVTFGNTGSGTDVFGFDNFTIGTPQQVVVSAVPEPASLLLLGTGLVGAAVRRRNKAKQQ